MAIQDFTHQEITKAHDKKNRMEFINIENNPYSMNVPEELSLDKPNKNLLVKCSSCGKAFLREYSPTRIISDSDLSPDFNLCHKCSSDIMEQIVKGIDKPSSIKKAWWFEL